jgi:biopolymer transport protein ExbD
MAMSMARAQAPGAGKAGRYALKQNSDINVTPFVDVMLVLLIVMMVTAPLATVSINLDVPRAAPGLPLSEPPPGVSLTEQGLYLLTGGVQRRVTVDALPGELAKVLGRAGGNRQVMVRADKKVKYRAFMAVISRLKSSGYNNLVLIAEN